MSQPTKPKLPDEPSTAYLKAEAVEEFLKSWLWIGFLEPEVQRLFSESKEIADDFKKTHAERDAAAGGRILAERILKWPTRYIRDRKDDAKKKAAV